MLRTNPNAINELSKRRGLVWHHILMVILVVLSGFNFFYGSRVIGGAHYGRR